MASGQPVFSRERIALLSVCVAAICAILWFATHRPAPAVPTVVVAAPAPTAKSASAKTSADTVKSTHKKKKRTKAVKKPKGYHPRERDYFKTPEEELPD